MKLSDEAIRRIEKLSGPSKRARKMAAELKLNSDDMPAFRRVVSACCGDDARKPRWTEHDMDRLKDMACMGIPSVNIAWMLGRSRESVNTRICRLRKSGVSIMYRRLSSACVEG